MADELVARFFNDLNEFVSETRPHNRLLSDAREDKLNRFCIVLAILDGLFKAFVFDHVRPESFSPFERTKSTHDILNAVSPVMVEDLTRLSRGFSRTFDVLSLDSVTVGPGFAGSDVVDGCEGDLIVDGMLIDLKTTAQPKIAGAWLKQLVCYYLMDLNDSYNITKLGVYLTRQSKLVDWDVPMLLQILTGNGKTDPMELRAEFRAAALQERKRHVGDNETVVPLSSISSPSSLTPRHPTKTRGIVSRLWDWLHRP